MNVTLPVLNDIAHKMAANFTIIKYAKSVHANDNKPYYGRSVQIVR
jgi:hypothetical protein